MERLKKLLNKLNPFKKRYRIGNRKVKKARFLYLYMTFGSLFGLGYFVTSLFFDFLPSVIALSPLFLIIAFAVIRFVFKNWKMIWMFVSDVDRGRLLLYLNKHTHWSEKHKLKAVKWVYLGRRRIRQETKLKLVNKITEGEKLTEEEKVIIKYKPVVCPQQLKGDQAGWNEAMLVDALIYAHRNIQCLDDDLRDIMNLTDRNILAFSLENEHRKLTDEDYAKKVKIGVKNAKKLEG